MSKKIKIEIEHWVTGSVLFAYETEDNTLRKTLEKAVSGGAYLRGADLRGADLQGVDLRGAYLRGAYLQGAYLRGADLRGVDLQGAYLQGAYLQGAYLRGADLQGVDLRGAYLRGAYLQGVDLEKLPVSYVNQASRDMLFIFQSLKSELPFLREKLIKGEVDGSVYEGDCACLVGTLANAENKSVEQVCEYIPFYDKGTHNPAEAWFLNIIEGDTPDNNAFAKHALMLIDLVLQPKKKAVKKTAK